MDLFKGIFSSVLVILFVCTGSYSSQLYLQPQASRKGVFTNDSFFITCFTTDANIEQLRWSDLESNTIDGTEGRIHVQPAGSGQQGLRLVFTSVEKEDSGTYTCSDDQNSISFELIVTRSVSFSDTPHVQRAPEGDTGVVTCNVRTDSHAVIKWYFNGTQIVENHKYNVMENHNLKIHNLSRTDAGIYKCKAYLITTFSSQVKDFDVMFHVLYRPQIIGDQRTSHYARIGSEVKLPCSVTSDPDPIFQWLRDEMLLYNGTEGYLIYSTANTSALQFNFENEDQLGEYICRASNSLGEEEVIVELKEGGPPYPPTMSVLSDDQGVVKLSLQPQEDRERLQELKTDGFKVEYKLASETWDKANSQEFKLGYPYVLRNMSFNSEYHFRAAGHNLAGYGEFSDEVSYVTQSLQVASVVANSSNFVKLSLVLLISIVLSCLF